MVSGRVDKGTGGIGRCERQWEGGRERSSLVGEWASGRVEWGERDEQEMQCKCAKVERKMKWYRVPGVRCRGTRGFFIYNF